MIEIPPGLVQDRVRTSGEAGREWLEALAGLVRRHCRELGVQPVDEPARHGANALVVPVRRGSEPCMLKISGEAGGVVDEACALRAWAGRHAVLLLDARPHEGVLLLERLDETRPLLASGLLAGAEVAGGLIRALAIPAPPELPRLRDAAAAVAESLQQRQNALGGPLPQRWVDLAAELARDLAAAAGDRLAHGDLHWGHILAGTRQPWLAIDPKPVAGDPELSVAELMWRGIEHSAASPADVRALLAAIVSAGELDAGKARAWTIVRAVDYWLWGLRVGLTEDPKLCRRLLEILV